MSRTTNAEDIKGRMLRNIAALWGIKNTEALDPLVKLLTEALAGELTKTHQEVQTFEKRILEKMALLMTPGMLSTPYCAHAVAQAYPVEPAELLTRESGFFYPRKKSGDADTQLNIHFTPAGNLPVFDAEIKYLAAGSKLYSFDIAGQKIPLQTFPQQEKNNIIWLGLDISPEIKNLKDLNFFFDFKNKNNKNQLFQQLHSAKWFIGSYIINTRQGLPYRDYEKPDSLFSGYDPMDMIEREVREIYSKNFIFLAGDLSDVAIKENLVKYPEEIGLALLPSLKESIDAGLLWFRIEIPGGMDEKDLHDLQVCCNAFPVINRKLKDFFYRFKGVSNIIPIQSDPFEYFISVEQLTDSQDKKYMQIPYSVVEQRNLGTYSVRKGGTERMDARSAKEFLLYLTDLIRDESAAFSSYGQDTVINMVKELDKLLAQLEQRIRKNNAFNKDNCHYVTVEYQKKQESFFMKYWVTNSVFANGIHAGSRLNVYQGSQIKSGSVQLLTNTTGGKNALEPSRHIEAYKYAMLTHNKLVTAEDIKAFCFYEIGDKVESVSIRKGLMVSEKASEGLVRCVEVRLKPKTNSGESFESEEWPLLLETLKSKMELRSSLNLNFNLLLEN